MGPLAADARLGKYELLSEIGQGGMSVVYRARDLDLSREVAIKVMHGFLADKPEARERFHREAMAVARLKHPHIIEIFDYSGAKSRQSYIVTELVEGSSLAAFPKGAITAAPEVALLIGRAVADALAHAHAQGVVHRDLKPENVLVGKDGALKLTDFGIARMLDSQTLTITGTLLGSPAYMAPEYIDSGATDARTDIFSLGAMLYQLVTGRLPFEAPSAPALLKRILAGEYLPPEQHNPKIHAEIARLLRRAMAKDPRLRFQSAAEVVAAIDAVLARLSLDREEERVRLWTDASYAQIFAAELVTRYVALGKEELARGRVGRALEDFDRVLAVVPDHKEVRALVRRLSQRRRVRRILRDAALVLAGVVVVTAAVSSWRARPMPPALAPKVVARLVTEEPPMTVRAVEEVSPARREGAAPKVKREAPKPRDVVAPMVKTKPVVFRVAGGLWVNVQLDGALLAREQQSPILLELAYGEHELRFSNPCCETSELRLHVSDTEPPELEPVALRPSPARLYVEGAPVGAFVEVGGKREGLRAGEPVFVPLEALGSTELLVLIYKGDEVLARERIRFEPGRTQKLTVR